MKLGNMLGVNARRNNENTKASYNVIIAGKTVMLQNHVCSQNNIKREITQKVLSLKARRCKIRSLKTHLNRF